MKMRDSFSVGVVFRPPKGSFAFCKSFRSDLRVTGSCASAAREVTSFGLMPFSISAQPGAVLARAISAGSSDSSDASRAAGSRDSRES